MDAKKIEDVFDRMFDVEYYLENGFKDDNNYVDLIQTWCQKSTVNCRIMSFTKGMTAINVRCFYRMNFAALRGMML